MKNFQAFAGQSVDLCFVYIPILNIITGNLNLDSRISTKLGIQISTYINNFMYMFYILS